ncbi:hypothetical protein CFPU101_02170 [Chroococcus sp. FPU101]|nr:hypothetical protein CFPU101_02170 [Chroococcus sp. FPU101]
MTGADKFVIASMLMICFALGQTVISLNFSESGQEKLATSLDLWMQFLYFIFLLY